MTFYFTAPYTTPEGNARATWYGFSGTPSVMFDGVIAEVGGLPSGTMFPYYQPDYVARSALASRLVMNAAYTVLNGQVDVTLTIQVDQTVSGTNTVHFFVCQDDLHGHPNMVVEVLGTEPFTLTAPGQSALIQRSFTMDAAWNEADLRIIALVQNSGTREILQAAQAVADYACTVVLDCVPDGVEAGWLLQGPGGLEMSGAGDMTLNLFSTGEFTLSWLDVPFWTSPLDNPQTQTAAQEGTITFQGTYSGGPFTALTSGPLGDAGNGQGVSLVDVDEDGDLDIHVVNDGTADQLLRNDGGGTFTDIAAGPIADSGAGRGAAWADFTGDGHLDLYLVKMNQANVLLVGNGLGGFAPDATYGAVVTGPGTSASWFDYEMDGDLDLYIVNRGTANALLKNLGDLGLGFLIFTPITGDPANDLGNGTGVSWTDGNLDGRPDPYVTNQYNHNLFLENTPLGFSDISELSGLDDPGNSTGAAWGDYDNDGDFDLYIANEGNADRLYRCTGNFHYSLVLGQNLEDPGNGRGVVWADFDNDGRLDVYVTRHDQRDLLLIGNGSGGFLKVPVGAAEADGPSNAATGGDLNGDGTIDLFISREGAPNVLLSNSLGAGNHWLEVRLIAAGSNTSAIGARIVATAGGTSQSRLVASGAGYMCHAPLTAHFGLGTRTLVDQLVIHWPDGEVQTIAGIPADRVFAVVQGQDPVSGIEDLPSPRITTLGPAHPNPFNPGTTITFDLAGPCSARLDVYALDGRWIKTLCDGPRPTGTHRVEWRGMDSRGRSVASGSYLYRLSTSDGFQGTGRMVLVK